MDNYLEQFVGDTRYFNLHRDNRIEELLKEAGIFTDNDKRLSYTIDSIGIVHVASYIHTPDEMHKMLLTLPPKYGIYDVSNGHSREQKWGNDRVVHFIEFRTIVCDRLRGEYDE